MTILHLKMQKLLGDFLLMKQDNIKPNYSQIAKETGVDRHTVAKYFKSGFKTIKTPKLRYENDPGECLQVDWKEEMNMTLSTGKLLPRIEQFAKDINVKINRCKVRHPYTKGKVESANRFLEWLKPYDNELDSEEDLIKVIQTIQQQANSEVNRTTGVPPMVLLKKELEYLSPLPNESLLNEYVNEADYKTVPCTLLIRHNGAEYSVPPEFIGKKVFVTESANKLLINYNTNVIAVHEIAPKNTIQYNPDHYAKGLGLILSTSHDKDEIRKMTELNTARLEGIGRQYEQ